MQVKKMREVAAHAKFEAVLTFRRVFGGLDFWHDPLITPRVHFDEDKFWAQIVSINKKNRTRRKAITMNDAEN
jgi:hypothetical protein